MKLSLYISNLTTDKFTKPIVQDLAFENLVGYHVKDSYDALWSDFMDENVAEALTHAKQEIEIANAVPKEENISMLKGHVTIC